MIETETGTVPVTRLVFNLLIFAGPSLAYKRVEIRDAYTCVN